MGCVIFVPGSVFVEVCRPIEQGLGPGPIRHEAHGARCVHGVHWARGPNGAHWAPLGPMEPSGPMVTNGPIGPMEPMWFHMDPICFLYRLLRFLFKIIVFESLMSKDAGENIIWPEQGKLIRKDLDDTNIPTRSNLKLERKF